MPVQQINDGQQPVVSTQNGSTVSPLVRFALRGLENCWLPQANRWSHIYHLDGRRSPNESLPPSDVFYTLNVLLGLSRLLRTGFASPHDLRSIFLNNTSLITELPVPVYAYGMALWTSAELGYPLPARVRMAVERLIDDRSGWRHWRAQDLGMILCGVVSNAEHDRPEWSERASKLYDFCRERFSCESGLFFDRIGGLRRRWASFASQTYLTLACYRYGEVFGQTEAIELANCCTRKLIELQGPMGEWPWFYDVMQGKVADLYEVYSVHQDGMAPAFLEHAEKHGVDNARLALKKGCEWIFGNNQLRMSMLVPELGLIIRSQVRRGELRTKAKRAARSLMRSFVGGTEEPVAPEHLQVRLECRSYHLGWVIWAFAARQDLPEITRHPLLVM
jgi:hypothetical protein